MAEPMVLEVEEVDKPRKSRAVTKANGMREVAPADEAPTIFGFTLEQIEKLPTEKLQDILKMKKEMRAEDAKRAFDEAKTAFKASAPAVLRDKRNDQFDSKYVSIGNLVNTVNEALAKHQLDASWYYDQTDTTIKCTCTLKHVQGHSESVTLAGPPDISGKKNPLQQIKSTTTYLRIATFEAVTGIATREGNLDDDGNGAAAKATDPDGDRAIDAKQLQELIDLCDDVGADKAKFCTFIELESLAQVRVCEFDKVKRLIEAKRKK